MTELLLIMFIEQTFSKIREQLYVGLSLSVYIEIIIINVSASNRYTISETCC